MPEIVIISHQKHQQMNYDIIIIGSGPGGYVSAIRASQLGYKTAVIEKAESGGICLNWGCIPTKALLKSAQVFHYVNHSSEYGIITEGKIVPDFPSIVGRSRSVAENMSKGVDFLLKKNKIELIKGFAKVLPGKKVEVQKEDGQTEIISATHIIIATGARSRDLPALRKDGKKIIGYREALTLKELPGTMIVVGSGAIGSEFAFLYQSLGTQVILVEMLPNILPIEDEDISKLIERTFKKLKMKVLTGSVIERVDTMGDKCVATISTPKGQEKIEADIVLSAVGIVANIENIGLEETGIKTEKGKIYVDEYYRTNVEGYYAIGDVIPGPALAHVASQEGITCIEHIAGLNPEIIDYNNIPACTYISPEVSSVGLSEKAAIDAGYTIKTGRFPFTASGKATASGSREGFIKVIFNAADNYCLGAHFAGDNVTEMIAEVVVARKKRASAHDLLKSIHPHPTMSEAFMEAIAAAYDEAIHL